MDLKNLEEIQSLAGRLRRGDLLQTLMDMHQLPFVICEFDMKTGLFLSMSASSQLAWGYKPGEMIGTSYQKYCVPDDLPESDKQVEENLNTGRYVYNFINRYYHRDGSVIHNNWCVSKPILDICLCICLYNVDT